LIKDLKRKKKKPIAKVFLLILRLQKAENPVLQQQPLKKKKLRK